MAFLLVLALLPFVLIEGPGAGLLSRLGWTDRDATFTELYFPDHLALPRTVLVGAPLEFDFSVSNREGTSATYSWQVLFGPEPGLRRGEAESSVVERGETRLENGEVAVVRVEQVAPVSPGRVSVSVVLVGRDEAIHFPVTIEPIEPPTE